MRRSRLGDIEDRFWVRVDKRGPDDCWNWTGTLSNYGYGRIAGKLRGELLARPGTVYLAHRISWIMANGPIPEGGPKPHGWVVMHKCDNPRCVNPAHLVLGSQRDNIDDMRTKRRDNDVGLSRGFGINSSRFSLTAEQVAEVLASEEPAKTLAGKFGVCLSVIQKVRRDNLSPSRLAELNTRIRRQGAPRGESVPNARLNDDLVRQIRASSNTNEWWSRQLGISETAIAQARRGQTFRHVT